MKNTNNYESILASKDARIAELEALVRFYEEQFRIAKSKQFGSSSEKAVSSEQLGLFDEVEITANPNLPEPELEQITYTRRKKGKREADLAALPLEIVEHSLPDEEQVCAECGEPLHAMGHDTRKELVIIPAQVKAVEHRRYTYACRHCERNGDRVPIVKAPVPQPLISGSLASASAVAHIMTQKYVMHVPLYRQEQDWHRLGYNLNRQTMANWIIRCAEDWLNPIYDRMRQLLLLQEVLHCDETTTQVLREPGKAATSTSYMWLYRSSGDTKRHMVLYEYQPSRSHAHPQRFLKNFKGYLHADGYSGYNNLPNGIIRIGCWTHMRRKWMDALKGIPTNQQGVSVAEEALKRIGYLFHLEEIWIKLTPEERHRRRLEESKPLAEEFYVWLSTLNALPKSAIGAAVHYALSQKQWLMNVYLDGRTEFSNNRAENSIRPFALGRKNWLFATSVHGAQASAVVYSIIETAKANGLKPYEYLEFLFKTLPNATSSAIDSLLPWGDAIPPHCRMSVLEQH